MHPLFHPRPLIPLLVLLVILLSFPACSPVSTANDFAYAAAPFTAAVRGTYTPEDGTPRPITARITAGEPLSGDDLTVRPLTVTFSAPATLAGITVTAVYEPHAEGGLIRTVTFTDPSPYGEIKTSSQTGDLDGFLRFAEALLPLGDIAEVSPVAEDGGYTITRATPDGKREAVFLFSADQQLPLRVTVRTEQEILELVVSP